MSRSAAIAGSLMFAPMVVAMRLPVLLAETGELWPWRSETMRAMVEKQTAMVEGLAAAQLSVLSSVAAFWPDLMAGRMPSMLDGRAAERSLQAALRPSGRAVRANYRRLGKRGRSA